MGYQRGDIAVVIAWESDDDFERRVDDINRDWANEPLTGSGRAIITKSGPHINSYATWVFNYHGSKQGWPDADRAERLRDQFIEAAQRYLRYPHVARVCIGLDSLDDTTIEQLSVIGDDEPTP